MPSGVLLGTPAYVPPEQLVQEPLDPRADIYAFGCLLHAMVTGRAPFPGGSLKALFHQHLSQPRPRLDRVAATAELPVGLQALIDGCTAKHLGDRPSSMDEVLGLLERSDAPRPDEGFELEIDLAAPPSAMGHQGRRVRPRVGADRMGGAATR